MHNIFSTRFKIAIFFTFLGVFILGLFSSVIVYKFHSDWIQGEKEEISEYFHLFQEKISKKGYNPNHTSKSSQYPLEYRFEKFFESHPKIQGKIFDSTGEIVFISSEFPEYKQENKNNKKKYFFSLDEYHLMLQEDFSFSDDFTGKIIISESIRDYDKQEHHFINITLLVTVLSVFFLFSIGYLFAWRILSPIRKISEQAKKISLHNISERLPLSGNKNDEIQNLSEHLNAMFARLEFSAKNLKQFTQDASHELRTPLAIIDSTLQLAIKTNKKEKIKEAREEIKNMNTLIDHLLELAKNEKNTSPSPEKIFLLPEIQNILKKISPHYSDKNISVSVDIPENFSCSIGKKDIQRVLTNFLSNAYKFSPSKEKIHITTKGKQCIISNVGSLSPAEQGKIFERFYRAQTSISSNGTGLGLAITKSIIEANGGKIFVESSEGSIRFIFEV